ncbi:MAG: cytochrome c [Gammaproteobacteria bacterium]|nr:cytochrome c [Gammaproteobacteria bacterium]MDH5691939.1 cytochrome c [Gammaproteobacteria bacterium]
MKLKTLTIFLAGLIVSTQVAAWPWSTDMMNQPSIKPQEGPPAAFPKRSIPTIGIPTKVANRQEAEKLKNPIKPTAESIKQGRKLFRIICAACHGLSGKADSPVSPKIGAIDLTSDYVQQTLAEGWIWGTITFGSAIMPAYGVPNEQGGSNDLSPEERWHVVNYVRKQLVRDSAGMASAN